MAYRYIKSQFPFAILNYCRFHVLRKKVKYQLFKRHITLASYCSQSCEENKLKVKFPTPVGTLNNVCRAVTEKSGQDVSCKYVIEKQGPDHETVFTCTVHLQWPSSQQFTADGRSKAAAKSAASLEAVLFLLEKDLIDISGRVKEYSKTQPSLISSAANWKKLLRSDVRLDIPLNFVCEAEELAHQYDTEVSPLLTRSVDASAESSEGEEPEPALRDLMTGKLLESFQPLGFSPKEPVGFTSIQKENSPYSYPIHAYREQILETIKNNPVVIIEGGTGCGKSTQVPQMILDEWRREGRGVECNVLVAQPRRLSTMSVAGRVAEERTEEICESVGYKIRLENYFLRRRGGIMFYTCGSLREGIRLNPSLEGVSHVIIDEVHERWIDTDMLLLLVKKALQRHGATSIDATGDSGSSCSTSIDTTVDSGSSCATSIDGDSDSSGDSTVPDINTSNGSMSVCTDTDINISGNAQDGCPPQLKKSPINISDNTSSCTSTNTSGSSITSTDSTSITSTDTTTEICHSFSTCTTEAKDVSASPSLKLILMSATAKVEQLKKYFNTDCVVTIEDGRPFPITVFYADEVIEMINKSSNVISSDVLNVAGELRRRNPTVDYKLVLETIRFIHRSKPDGAVLVFLPGWNDIVTLERMLKTDSSLWVLPLHSKVAEERQKSIFEPSCDGQRKVILATNIAETSITINDVVYVVDVGLQNDNRFSASKNVSTFGTVWISKANAEQRMGRAGRVQPGEVFRLYTREDMDRMDQFPKPQMLKLPLESVVMRIKSQFEAYPVRSILAEMIEGPSQLAIASAVETLIHLRLLQGEQTEGDSKEYLTALGRASCNISTSPALAKSLIYAVILGCEEAVLNFVSMENEAGRLFIEPLMSMDFQQLKLHHNDRSDVLAMCNFLHEVMLTKRRQHFHGTDEEEESESDLKSWEEDPDRDISAEEREKSREISAKEGGKSYSRSWKEICDRENAEWNAERDGDGLSDPINNVSSDILERILKLKNLFRDQLRKTLLGSKTRNLDETMMPNVGKNCPELILCSILSAANVLVRQVNHDDVLVSALRVIENGVRVRVMKGSVLHDWFSKSDNMLVSTDLVFYKDRNCLMTRDSSIVVPESVALFYGPQLHLRHRVANTEGENQEDTALLGIRGRDITFVTDKRTADSLIKLRTMWEDILDSYVDGKITHDPHMLQFSTDSTEAAERETRETISTFLGKLNNLINRILDQRSTESDCYD